MPLIDTIRRFATGGGPYTVTRTAVGTYTNGVYTPGAASTLSVTLSIQPISGRDLHAVPEGQYAEDLRIAYTTTELFTRSPGRDPDVVTIDGEAWTVIDVDRWESSGTYYRAKLARKVTP